MASTLITPPSTQLPTYNQTTPYYTFTSGATTTNHTSPGNSGSQTPFNSSSPTSPQTASTSPNYHRNPCHPRQLRPPKAPLYVPAVLRPTEKPAKYCRQKSDGTNGNYTSTANNTALNGMGGIMTPPSTPSTSFDSNSNSGIHAAEEGVLRRMLGEEIARQGITRVVTDEWNDELLEDVTGQPTRDHWKPDILSTSCDHPPCPTPFTLFTRRHHCRRCGNIFCTSHSSHTVPLDQHARFHPAGSAGRACDSCWGDYLAWKKVRGRGSMSTEGSSGSVTPRGDGNGEVAVEGIKVKRVVKSAKEDVGSVPRDWNWSTF